LSAPLHYHNGPQAFNFMAPKNISIAPSRLLNLNILPALPPTPETNISSMISPLLLMELNQQLTTKER